MTEKVKVTKEQAEAIEEFQKTVHELGISLDELKVIFESGYEVKPEFKVGDWFVYIGKDGEVAEYIKKGFTGQVEAVHYGFITDGYHRFYNSEIRHATPSEITEEKERRWWKKHGREFRQLKQNDLIIDTRTGEVFSLSSIGVRNGFNKFYKVICFAENRLDREGGE